MQACRRRLLCSKCHRVCLHGTAHRAARAPARDTAAVQARPAAARWAAARDGRCTGRTARPSWPPEPRPPAPARRTCASKPPRGRTLSKRSRHCHHTLSLDGQGSGLGGTQLHCCALSCLTACSTPYHAQMALTCCRYSHALQAHACKCMSGRCNSAGTRRSYRRSWPLLLRRGRQRGRPAEAAHQV